ncbi:MAG: BREX-1 system adenine-specific DNA-methyltransferase PglX [Prevotella sp.]|nr:BREX-1 system adenine-specific DNA-methyltransferase PglX [Prevotella sp.]
MDTNRLKRFAVEARNILMLGVKNRLQAIGFDLKTGTPTEMPQKMEGGAVFMGDTVTTDFYSRWMSLYNNIHARGIKQVAEEAAYTWFNRFMAIRIMQKQGFISPVLAYESEEVRVPVIVSEARQGRMPQMAADVHDKLMELLDDDSKTNEQFALLIVAYCHENPIINKCFGAIADYTELLLPQNILAEGGFVSMLNRLSSESNDVLAQSLPSREGGRPKANDTEFITDADFRSPELIGWLYQFYISDRKAEAMAKKGQYDTDDLAPATQIFTPNWIVKYMVENTVGRIYIDNNPYCEAKDEWKYLVDTPSGDQTLQVDDLAELTVADLACGSGHILNECFDLLYSLYVKEGYSRSQAISNILRKNILGIDLDTRAKQLATFALLMKACQKDNSFLDGKVMPRVYDMPRPIAEAMGDDADTCNAEEYLKETLPHYLLGGNTDMVKELTDAILLMNHADTLGSIMKFDISEQTRNAVMVRTQEYEEQLANGEIVPSDILLLMPYMRIILALTEKYAALVMNPPYMGSGHFDEVLGKYVKDNYAEGKADLFSVFMQMGMERLAANGKMAQINMQSWMFLSSFEKLRKQFLTHYNIDNMLHLGPRTFDELSGEIVQNTAFVLSKHEPVEQGGVYYRLVDGKNCADKEQLFLSHINGNVDGNRIYYPNVEQKDFEKIPGCPIGYWVSDSFRNLYKNKKVKDYAKPIAGICTGYNDGFLRLWYEVNPCKIGQTSENYEEALEQSKYSWYIHYKGGPYRRWYGNRDYVLHYSREVLNIMQNNNGFRHDGKEKYFHKGITWSKISSGIFSARQLNNGCTFDSTGTSAFPSNDNFDVILGVLNSKIIQPIINLVNPTMAIYPHDIAGIPIVLSIFDNKDQISISVEENISLSKQDWDAHETSWDFQRNELLSIDEDTYMENINYEIEKHIEETGEHLCIDPAAPQLDSLAWRIEQYKQKWEHKFKQLHKNEEELNRQFIDIYGLQDELTPDVPLNEITILQQGEISIE